MHIDKELRILIMIEKRKKRKKDKVEMNAGIVNLGIMH